MTLAQKEEAPRLPPPAPPKGLPRRTCSTTNLAPIRDDDKVWELVFASWARVIRRAPIENKRLLLSWMARDAAAWADACRQRGVDDMWQVADELGLIKLLGITDVQAAIAAGFDGGAA
jgi:hypothetical protein